MTYAVTLEAELHPQVRSAQLTVATGPKQVVNALQSFSKRLIVFKEA